jgi:hypothetical protein
VRRLPRVATTRRTQADKAVCLVLVIYTTRCSKRTAAPAPKERDGCWAPDEAAHAKAAVLLVQHILSGERLSGHESPADLLGDGKCRVALDNARVTPVESC